MSEITIRRMTLDDVREGARLQPLAFPPPFREDLLWTEDHLRVHIDKFPEGQFVATLGDVIVGTSSSCLISETTWQAHNPWEETVGSAFIDNHRPNGSTLYGVDITVHPSYRKRGIGRRFYDVRFDLVRRLGLSRYGTGCRIPDFAKHGTATPEEYAHLVVEGRTSDRTLTPLLRYGLNFVMVVRDYMDDAESGNAAALLEWQP